MKSRRWSLTCMTMIGVPTNKHVTTPCVAPRRWDAIAEPGAHDGAGDADPGDDPPVPAVASRQIHAGPWRDRARMKVEWSTLPPEQITATARSCTGSLPVSAA